MILVETALLGCHFQIICFGLKVGLEGGWARLEFKIFIVVFSLGFIQLQDFLFLKKTYPIVDLPLLENRLLGYFVRMWDGWGGGGPILLRLLK